MLAWQSPAASVQLGNRLEGTEALARKVPCCCVCLQGNAISLLF